MKRVRLAALEDEMGNPEVFGDPKKAAEMGREHVHLKKVLGLWDEFESVKREIEGNRELVKGRDAEMAEMAAEEIPGLEARVEELQGAAASEPDPARQKELYAELHQTQSRVDHLFTRWAELEEKA